LSNLALQNLVFFGQEIIPNLNYASSPLLNPFKSEGGQDILKSEKQEMVIGGLVEGSSIWSIERMTGVHRDTIMRLMVSVGNSCEKIMDTSMRNLTCKDIEVDEVWSFVGKKQRHVGPMDNPNMVGDF